MDVVQRLIKQVGIVTTSLCVGIIVLSFMAMTSTISLGRLTLSPGSALLRISRPWTLVTGSLVETNPLKLLISVPAIAYFGRIIESRVSLPSFAAFVVVSIAGAGVIIALGTVVLYFMTRNTGLLFDDIYGSFGVVETLAVGAFQLDPDTSVPRVPTLSHKLVPSLVLAVTLVVELLLGLGEDTAFVCVSLVLSWCYLRFWQPRGPSRGDWREEFAFAHMFAEAFRPPVEAVGRVVYSLLGRLWFFREPAVPPPPLPTGVHHQDVEAPEAPLVVDPVAERRRARALKALNSRMASMGKPRGGRTGGRGFARQNGQRGLVPSQSTAASGGSSNGGVDPVTSAPSNADGAHGGGGAVSTKSDDGGEADTAVSTPTPALADEGGAGAGVVA